MIEYCQHCGTEFKQGAKFCSKCGEEIGSKVIYRTEVPKKKGGFLLFLGLLLCPIIFVWVTLKEGTRTWLRVFGWGWLALALYIVYNVGEVETTDYANNPVNTYENIEKKPKLELIEHEGAYSNGFFTIRGKVHNNRSWKYSYVQISFNLYDDEGVQVGTAMANTNNLEPDTAWQFEALSFDAKGASSYKVGDTTGW